jgi:hypothetical protein
VSVVPKVARKGRAGRYLVVTGIHSSFQIRIPKSLVACRSLPPLRVRLGVLGRREAQRRAEELAVLARRLFAERRRTMDTNQDTNVGTEEWVECLLDHIKWGAARLQDPPPRPEPLQAAGLASIGGLVGIEQERRKGPEANPIIVNNQDRLRAVYYDRLRTLGSLADALATDAGKDGLYDKLSVFAPTPVAAPTVAPETPLAPRPAPAMAVVDRAYVPVAPAKAVQEPLEDRQNAMPAVTKTTGSNCPKFSQVAQEYISMRAAAGAEKGELDSLRVRRDTWIGVMEDLPVDRYSPGALQKYVNAMRYWPQGVTKRDDPEMNGKTVKDILESNKDLHLAPLKRKTMEDGYLGNVKTMFRHGVIEHEYRYPFEGVRISWPKTYAGSTPREAISPAVLNQCFILGVESGVLDAAMLPLLSYLTSRRIGALCYLRGEDIRQKHGVWVARTNGVVFDEGVWKRVPIKTDESLTFFVLPKPLEDNGFVDWARRQEGFVFKMIHEYANVTKQTSKNLNRLLRRAGAIGANIEVLHSLRGERIHEMRERNIDPRARRQQAGHELGDEHEQYGSRSMVAVQCHRIRNLKLPKEFDLSVFHGLDFDALAAGRRTMGRKPKDHG